MDREAAAEQTRYLYRTLLGREPGVEALAYCVDLLAAGGSTQVLEQQILDSEEYKAGGAHRRLSALENRLEKLQNFVVPMLWSSIDELHQRTRAPTDRLECLACGEGFPRSASTARVDECMFGGGRLERYECPSCGCVFGPEAYLAMTPALIAADMSLLYSTYSEADSTENEVRAFHMLEPREGGRYLNWGAGAWSRSVEVLRAQGFDVHGYEPHVSAGSSHVAARVDDLGGAFDGIFSNNVLEHLTDPAGQFRQFKALLKPGGRMAHATPCYEWLYAYTRFHVFFPLGDSIEALARRTGFRVIGSVRDGPFDARLFQ